MLNENRRQTAIIVSPEIMMLHFCDCGLEGAGNEAWYPFEQGKLFEAVEKYMTLAKIAHNVVGLEETRQCGKSVDYIVTFNPVIADDAELEVRSDFAYSIAESIEAKTDDLEIESMVFRKWAGILGGFLSLSQMREAHKELVSDCQEMLYLDL
jgi:hypothetical protein